jgi:hypothetical protein
MLLERDVIESASALGEVLPNRRLYGSVAYVVEWLDFIHDLSFANLLVNRGLAGKDMDSNRLFLTLRDQDFLGFPQSGLQLPDI